MLGGVFDRGVFGGVGTSCFNQLKFVVGSLVCTAVSRKCFQKLKIVAGQDSFNNFGSNGVFSLDKSSIEMISGGANPKVATQVRKLANVSDNATRAPATAVPSAASSGLRASSVIVFSIAMPNSGTVLGSCCASTFGLEVSDDDQGEDAAEPR